MSQTSPLVRLSSLFVSFFLVTPNAIPATRIGPAAPQTQASTASSVTLQVALAALVGNANITDVTLSGSVRRIAGSDDQFGTATLKALSTGAARADFGLSSGPSSEIQNATAAPPAGNWSGPDGVSHPIAFHNLLAEPAWFFPAFAISRRLASGYTVTDLGPTTLNGQRVEHISVSQNSDSSWPAGTLSFQHLTQVDFFLDSSTALPAAISFNVHPDNNAGFDIPVQILFSDYRSVSPSGVVAGLQTGAVQIPFHIQKFLNNSLFLDIQLQSVSTNSGLSASSFSL